MAHIEQESMELRCQVRFVDEPSGARVLLEAGDPAQGVSLTLEASGANKREAITLLAERTRALYSAVCGMVETVEDLARTYAEVNEESSPEEE